MPDLYPAQLDGFDLEIETIADSFEKAIIRHEYPYKNGALLEDMGAKARVIRFRCYFWDDGADHATYDAHTGLLSRLEGLEIVELVHPKYGPLRGSVESLAVKHDDRDRTAEIDVTFIHGLIEDAGETSREDIKAGSEEAFNDSIAEQKQVFEDDVTAALGSEAGAILGKYLDPALGILEQITDVSTKARNYLKTVESFVGKMEGTLNTITNPANSLISIINYGTSLAGRVIGSVARCVERYAILYTGLKSAPPRFIGSMQNGLAELTSAVGGFNPTTAKTTTIASASYTALQLSYIYKEDETTRADQVKTEGQPVFDALGNYTASDFSAADSPAMTVREMESSLAVVRSMIQASVNLSREMPTLRTQALLLQSHVAAIKLQRENVTSVLLDNTMPLHLVCLRYGLPYNAAERLLMINDIRNPNEVSGKVNVYVS